MVDLAALTGAVSALQAAAESTKLIISARDASVVREKAIELQAQILSAQTSALTAQSNQLTLLERVRQLEEQIAHSEEWRAEKEKYELKEVAAGAFAYAIKPDARSTEPFHWLCAACYQKSKKSIIQMSAIPGTAVNRWAATWVCPSCAAKIVVPHGINPAGASPS